MQIFETVFSTRLLLWGSVSVIAAYLYLFRLYSVRMDARSRRRREEARERMMDEAESALVKKDILTPNEREFFGRLQAAAADIGLEVVPQVAMGALLDVSLDKKHPLYWPLRRRFDKKIIDFVVYVKRTMQVLTIVELDDRTHDPEKDRKRDAMMAKAGFRTVRWDSRAKPSIPVIRQKFSELLNRQEGRTT